MPRGWQLSNHLTDQQKCLPECFLQPSTYICIAKESLLASKPTLKALLIWTDASLHFIGTYIKKKITNFWRHCLYLSLQREGAECKSWGTLGLPWRFQAERESTSVILGCSTKAFQPRSCWRRKQHCLLRKCLPSVRTRLWRAAAYPPLPPPPSPAPTEIAACMWDTGEACRALLQGPSTCIYFCILSTQPRQAETNKENEVWVYTQGGFAFAQMADIWWRQHLPWVLHTSLISLFNSVRHYFYLYFPYETIQDHPIKYTAYLNNIFPRINI